MAPLPLLFPIVDYLLDCVSYDVGSESTNNRTLRPL